MKKKFWPIKYQVVNMFWNIHEKVMNKSWTNSALTNQGQVIYKSWQSHTDFLNREQLDSNEAWTNHKKSWLSNDNDKSKKLTPIDILDFLITRWNNFNRNYLKTNHLELLRWNYFHFLYFTCNSFTLKYFNGNYFPKYSFT